MKTNKALKPLKEVNEKPATPMAPDGVRVADVARDLKLNPKQVRARLRKLYRDADVRASLPAPVANHTWTFREEDRDAVVALIRSLKGEDAE